MPALLKNIILLAGVGQSSLPDDAPIVKIKTNSASSTSIPVTWYDIDAEVSEDVIIQATREVSKAIDKKLFEAATGHSGNFNIHSDQAKKILAQAKAGNFGGRVPYAGDEVRYESGQKRTLRETKQAAIEHGYVFIAPGPNGTIRVSKFWYELFCAKRVNSFEELVTPIEIGKKVVTIALDLPEKRAFKKNAKAYTNWLDRNFGESAYRELQRKAQRVSKLGLSLPYVDYYRSQELMRRGCQTDCFDLDVLNKRFPDYMPF